MTPKQIKLVVLVIFLLGLAGCTPLIKSVQPLQTDYTNLQDGKTIGQTFTTRYDGLQSVAIYLNPDLNSDADVTLQLKKDPNDPDILATATRKAQDIADTGYFRFDFLNQQFSNQQDYYFQLELDGPGTILVGNSTGETYLHGSQYINQATVDSQLTFRLGYDTSYLILGILKEILSWALIILACAFLFLLPGWILLSIYWTRWRMRHWGTKLGLSVGLSLAIYPIFFVWTDVLNIHLGEFYAWLPPIISIFLLVWHKRKNLYPLRFSIPALKSPAWSDITLVIIILLIFGVRFWAIRSLDLPMWGDSYQHTMITQLIIDNTGLFQSWEPYAVLQTLTYHFGFHALTAVFHWATGLETTDAVLWMGQIINGLAVITLFPLAMRIRRNPWAGIITLLCAGLLFSMPMYYVNWGRYTQLTGLALLLVYTYFIWSLLDSKTTCRFTLVAVSLLLSGLALSHYRVLIFALILIPVLFLMYVSSVGFKKLLLRIIFMGIASTLIFLPWFINVFSGRLLDIVGYQVSTPADQLTETYQGYVGIGDLTSYLPITVWIVLLPLVGWALWRRQKGVTLIAAWWFLVFLAANPHWLNLPGTGTITAFAVLISTFIPASLIIGESSAWVIEKLSGSKNKIGSYTSKPGLNGMVTALFAILICLAGVWGANKRRADLDTFQHMLITRPDIRAAEWIQDNLNETTGYLVNSFFAYGDSLIAGSDGGWWLPLQANARTTLPPLNYGSENGPVPNYAKRVNALTVAVEQLGIDDPVVIEMLETREITHVYIGQRQGEVNNNNPLLDITQLIDSPHYDQIFHQDRVWIFRINYE